MVLLMVLLERNIKYILNNNNNNNKMKYLELTKEESVKINGGLQEDYDLGYEIGEHIGKLLDKVSSWF